MVKAVIFDVGGVLIRTTDHTHRRQWEKELGLAAGEAEAIVFNSEMGLRAQRGEITDADLWQWIGDHLKLTAERLTAFHRGFWAGDELDVALVDYIRSLRSRYQTAVISNATDSLQTVLHDQHQIADAFDLIVGSAYEKVMKPDPIIYRRTLARLDRQAEETVFIDDFAHNIAAAETIGMHTIHFTPEVDVPAELAALGVQPETGWPKA